MALSDSVKLMADGAFVARVQEQLVSSAIAIYNEVANDVQTISVTGSPTGGSFTLASLPGSATVNQTGTLTNAATTCTGLSSTVGLFVGMSVTGQNVAAGCTITAIPSLTAVTLSANSSGTGAQALTFSGTPVASIPWNASASDVQAILAALSTIADDDVLCAGGPLPGTGVSVTFQSSFAGEPQRLMTIGTNSLTGGSTPTPSVARTTAGVSALNHTKRAQLATNVLRNPSGYAALMVAGVAVDATVLTDYGANGANGQSAVTDAHIATAVASLWNAYAG